MSSTRAILIWGCLAAAIVVPIAAAAASPQLAWRDPIYITAGFAGIISMVFLLIQPLMVGGWLPGISARARLKLHRWVGASLVVAVLIHVIGLWLTSPPDVIDALLFASPTPFSAWGVIAMWAVFAAAILALLRRRLTLNPRHWRMGHTALVTVTVIASAVHAIQIEGTMETVSKSVLCALVLIATVKVIHDLRIWTRRNQGTRNNE